jgi:hypothetical protein
LRDREIIARLQFATTSKMRRPTWLLAARRLSRAGRLPCGLIDIRDLLRSPLVGRLLLAPRIALDALVVALVVGRGPVLFRSVRW